MLSSHHRQLFPGGRRRPYAWETSKRRKIFYVEARAVWCRRLCNQVRLLLQASILAGRGTHRPQTTGLLPKFRLTWTNIRSLGWNIPSSPIDPRNAPEVYCRFRGEADVSEGNDLESTGSCIFICLDEWGSSVIILVWILQGQWRKPKLVSFIEDHHRCFVNVIITHISLSNSLETTFIIPFMLHDRLSQGDAPNGSSSLEHTTRRTFLSMAPAKTLNWKAQFVKRTHTEVAWIHQKFPDTGNEEASNMAHENRNHLYIERKVDMTLRELNDGKVELKHLCGQSLT